MTKTNLRNALPPAEEAARYLDNARKILTEKAGKKRRIVRRCQICENGFRHCLFRRPTYP